MGPVQFILYTANVVRIKLPEILITSYADEIGISSNVREVGIISKKTDGVLLSFQKIKIDTLPKTFTIDKQE